MNRFLLTTSALVLCSAGARAQPTHLQFYLWDQQSDSADQFSPMYAPQVHAYAITADSLPVHDSAQQVVNQVVETIEDYLNVRRAGWNDPNAVPPPPPWPRSQAIFFPDHFALFLLNFGEWKYEGSLHGPHHCSIWDEHDKLNPAAGGIEAHAPVPSKSVPRTSMLPSIPDVRPSRRPTPLR